MCGFLVILSLRQNQNGGPQSSQRIGGGRWLPHSVTGTDSQLYNGSCRIPNPLGKNMLQYGQLLTEVQLTLSFVRLKCRSCSGIWINSTLLFLAEFCFILSEVATNSLAAWKPFYRECFQSYRRVLTVKNRNIFSV